MYVSKNHTFLGFLDSRSSHTHHLKVISNFSWNTNVYSFIQLVLNKCLGMMMMIFSLGPSPLLGHREGTASEWADYWWDLGSISEEACPWRHQPLTHYSLRCLPLPLGFIAQNPDQSSEHDTDSSSVFSVLCSGFVLNNEPFMGTQDQGDGCRPCRQLATLQSRYSWECGIIWIKGK